VAVTEGGATDTYTLVLDSQPPSTVTISLAASNGQVTVSPASVSISPATWNQPRTITVTAVNDNVAEGAQSATIHHTMAGPTGWSGLPVADVSVAITDNDAPGLVITSTGGAPDRVTEGGAGDGFNVRLASQPTSTVKVSVTTTDAKLNVVYTELTFLPDSTDWNTVHLAWFTAPDDAIASGTRDATITFTVTSGDANYVALAPVQKTMNVVDND
jgi:hypothetical protein